MSKENIQKIANELRKQGCKFLLCGTDEQKKPFYEFHGGTPEEAIKASGEAWRDENAKILM